MIRKRVSCLLLLGATAVFAGCAKDTDGEPVTPTVVAGLRYVNLVPDTSGMDIRVIDVIGDAPNTSNATFRSGGQPYGIAITGLPLHTAVLAGDRHIRAFMSAPAPFTDTALATTVMLDTTFNFVANTNYTVYLWGYASGTAPALSAMIVEDNVPTLTAGQVAIRVANLAPTIAGTTPAPVSATSALDVYFRRFDVEAVAGTPAFASVAPGTLTAYAVADTATWARFTITETGTTTGLLSEAAPQGTAGTPTANPVAGTRVGGTALTAIIVPPSVAGTAAPQGGTLPASRTTQELTNNAGLVTVRRGTRTVLENRPAGAADSVTATTGTATVQAAVGNVVYVSGAAEAQYNGYHQVISLAADTLISCTPTDPGDTATNCAAASVVALYHTNRFRYRIAAGAPSPATGTIAYRAFAAGATNAIYTGPTILYIIDKLPPFTAP